MNNIIYIVGLLILIHKIVSILASIIEDILGMGEKTESQKEIEVYYNHVKRYGTRSQKQAAALYKKHGDLKSLKEIVGKRLVVD